LSLFEYLKIYGIDWTLVDKYARILSYFASKHEVDLFSKGQMGNIGTWRMLRIFPAKVVFWFYYCFGTFSAFSAF
jgi:hypothetical protein